MSAGVLFGGKDDDDGGGAQFPLCAPRAAYRCPAAGRRRSITLENIGWSLPLTLGVFFASRRLASRVRMPLLNPLLVSTVVIIALLLVTGIPYNRYFSGSKVLNDLLQPAVVALAYPLYEQLHQIRSRWKSIISICFAGSLTAMVSGATIALWMGVSPEMAASIMPKSVTTPIAMVVSQSIGGIPAVTAVCVIIRRHSWRGFRPQSVQAAADFHPGTARCAELDFQEGAFSSLALVICGIITSLIAPFVFPLLLKLFG